ncbi:hypothetical protein EON67_10410 [archaeon]|nr:MAG: hypothetical protein EON67_10410 [archaeon]
MLAGGRSHVCTRARVCVCVCARACAFCRMEENRQFGEAEEYGMQAVHLDPSDAWGIHAVAHVYEETCRTNEGKRFLSEMRSHWADASLLDHHIAWHWCLFDLEEGNYRAAISRYDNNLGKVRTRTRTGSHACVHAHVLAHTRTHAHAFIPACAPARLSALCTRRSAAGCGHARAEHCGRRGAHVALPVGGAARVPQHHRQAGT